jgi:hypothetical protein
MTASPDGLDLRVALRAALVAAGLEATDERVERLLPAYEGMRAATGRLRAIDLEEAEPAVIFRVPPPAPA